MTETDRIAFGEEVRAAGSDVIDFVPVRNVRCPDCGVKRGGVHELDCHLEQCPRCGEPLAHCGHRKEIIG